MPEVRQCERRPAVAAVGRAEQGEQRLELVDREQLTVGGDAVGYGAGGEDDLAQRALGSTTRSRLIGAAAEQIRARAGWTDWARRPGRSGFSGRSGRSGFSWRPGWTDRP